MKNKIMLAELIHSPAQAQQKHGAHDVVCQLDVKKVMQQISLAVFLFPINK
ncbi:hypothetical protein [Longitalea arenae]|uniref:hypothetical protein n=1 Tax=Longitalea arenae TaxID=2812558 RepID=UPI001967CD5C|nr:hypothetical protein [Longitalea arenae]